MLKKEHIFRVLLLLVMVVLLLPLLQESTGLWDEKPLRGALVPAKKPGTEFTNWWNGTYQDSFEVYQNEQFGLRNDFVRLHNQVEFDLFQKASVNQVVVGKNNYLYELKYIKAYNGDDFIGTKNIETLAQKLKVLQDTLTKRNITLIVAFAPGKASFYPEYIPDELRKPRGPTNYESFVRAFQQGGVNTIDFNKWFISQKENAPAPLYPKTGIHWSRYGSVLAIDSLIRYIENKRQVDMPSVVMNGFSYSDSLQSPDDDLGKSLNLIYDINPLLMGYASYNFENPDGKAKVRMMVISDSFFWNMFDIRLAPRSFASIDFWYYNQQAYHTDGRPVENANEADNCLETQNNDVVLLLASEPDLSGLGWGYIDDAYDYFVLKNADRVKNKLQRYYETHIRMDQAWMMTIKAKAIAAKVPLDSMIRMDARYMTKQKMGK